MSMGPLTDDELRLIGCLEPQITQGPWKHQRIGHRVVTVDECEADCVCVAPSEIHFPCSAEYWEANAQFIVQARHMLPRAVAEIESLRQKLADVTADRDRLQAELTKPIDALRVCRMPVQVEQAHHAVLAAVAETKKGE